MSKSVSVEFSAATQSHGALDAAAYRLIGTASCQIEKSGEKWVCHLTSSPSARSASAPSAESLRANFIDLVTDENMRERIAVRTDRVRDVILALAFGALATGSQDQSK